jgi:chromate reductase
MSAIRVVGFSGSLRKASFNSGLLRAAVEAAPEGVSIEIVSLADLPLLNTDLVSPTGEFPPAVAAVRAAVAGADGVLFSSPEYNASISSVTKTLVDWLSRPPAMPLEKKPVALMGATPGRIGTARGQVALRSTLAFAEIYVMSKPELLVPEAGKKFDASGNLTDGETREHLAKFVAGFAAWVRRFKGEK